MSDQEIKITVVIPTRNESKFLGSTLDALRHQILKPCRIIVISDGSVEL